MFILVAKKELYAWLEGNENLLTGIASKIWEAPELAFEESMASELLSSVLEKAGFRIRKDLKDMPTAFSAEYGSGRPVIGILGEYDALPDLSQKVSAAREPVKEGAPGQGCGHNLLGTAGVGAVLAVQKGIEQGLLKGTIRYYGCPAEETLAGKVFMAREGVFNDLDVCLSWHPASMNVVWGCGFLAMNSVTFNFKGVPAHAAAAPHLGRSALDGVELMNVGANYLREHIFEKARLHYTITNGGGAPNIVPEKASVWYYIRAPKREQVEEIFERLKKIAGGAALMTETEVEWRVLAGCYEVLPSETLGDLITSNMREVGPPRYSEEDRKLAGELAATFPAGQKEKVMASYFAPPEIMKMTLHEGISKNQDREEVMAGSTDVGDVSWLVPLAQFTASTWPVGTAAHSWQATAASGSGIGFKAMLFAAKTLAGCLYDLLRPEGTLIIDKAKEEFARRTGGFKYKSPLGQDSRPAAD